MKELWKTTTEEGHKVSFSGKEDKHEHGIGVPAGSPSHGEDVVVYVFDINQPSLATSLYSVLVSISVFIALSTIFHFINSPDNSPLSHCSSSLISALMVRSAIYLFIKVSFSPDIILCG